MSDRCRSCGAEITWAITVATGRPMPVDVEERADGNLRLDRNLMGELTAEYVAPGEGTHVSHFATCDDPKQWRKR